MNMRVPCMMLASSLLANGNLVYWMDYSMMMLTGKEKTAKQFSSILDAAGLELVKIWPFAFGAQAIVEAKLKSQ